VQVLAEPQPDAKLIDYFLPEYDVSAAYGRTIKASASDIFRVIRETEFGNSWIIRWLFAMRSLSLFFRHSHRPRSSYRGLKLGDLAASGFHVLGEWPEREIVIGVVGRFWRLTGNINHDVPPESFMQFADAGYCKAAWNFRLQPLDDHCTRVTTETRIQPLDKRSRRRFRLYWFFIGAFSGLIRTIMLHELAKQSRSTT